MEKTSNKIRNLQEAFFKGNDSNEPSLNLRIVEGSSKKVATIEEMSSDDEESVEG